MTAEHQDWSGLGFNPAPGAAHVVDNLVSSMAKLARHLNEVYEILDRIKSGKDETWTGEAADAFKKHVGKLPAYMRDASDGAAQARKALHGWHQILLENQPQARSLEAQAKAARKNLQKAETGHRNAQDNPDLGLADQTFEHGPELERAKQRYKAASNQLDDAVNTLNTAHDKLNDLIRRAHSLEDDHKSVAHAKERAIREAADSTADPEWNDASDWWDQHGGDVLGVAAGVLGVAAFFCPILAPLAVLASLVAMGLHSYKYAKKGALWPPQKHVGNYITLGGDLLGVIPGAKLVGTGISAAARETGGVRSLLTAGEGVSRTAKVQQGVRAGSTALRDNYGEIIERGAQEAPWMVEKAVGKVASSRGWDEATKAAVERSAAVGGGGTVTATQVPSLYSDSKQAEKWNTRGGAAGNAFSGFGSGVTGTVTGVAGAAGLYFWGDGS